MADKRIGELPSAAGVYGDSLFVMEQQSTAMSVRGELISNFAKQEVSEYVETAKQATEDAKQAAKDAAESLGDLNNQVELAEGYANNAKSSATEAKKSEQTANTYKTAAETAKTAAAESAEQSKTSADAAAESLSQANEAKTAAAESANNAKESETAAAESLANTEIAQQAAEKAAEKSEKASSNPPIVQDGNWWTWDKETEQYKDSGIDANVSLAVGTVTTGEPGTQAKVENSGTETDAVLNFTIPQGNQGVSVESFTQTEGNHSPGTTDIYQLELSDGQTFDVSVYNGADGVGTIPKDLIVGDGSDLTMEIAKIETLHHYVDDSKGDAIAPRTVLKAISGVGNEGQVVGFVADNVLGVIDALDLWDSKTTTFNSDGSITEETPAERIVTTFNADGSITESRYEGEELRQTRTTYFDGSVIREEVE